MKYLIAFLGALGSLIVCVYLEHLFGFKMKDFVFFSIFCVCFYGIIMYIDEIDIKSQDTEVSFWDC